MEAIYKTHNLPLKRARKRDLCTKRRGHMNLQNENRNFHPEHANFDEGRLQLLLFSSHPRTIEVIVAIV